MRRASVLVLLGCGQPATVAPVPTAGSAAPDGGGSRAQVVLAESLPDRPVAEVRVSRDARRVGVLGGSGQAFRLDLATGAHTFTPGSVVPEEPRDLIGERGVRGAALDPDLDAVALVFDGTARLVRNGVDARPLTPAKGYRPPVEGSAFSGVRLSPDGTLLLARYGHAESQDTRVFDARTGIERDPPFGREGWLPALDRNAKRAASPRHWEERGLYVRDLPGGKERKLDAKVAWTVELSPDGSLLAWDTYAKQGRPDAEVHLWDLARDLERCSSRGYGPSFSPSGERLLVQTDEDVTLRRASDCAVVARFEGPLFGETPIGFVGERLAAVWPPTRATVLIDLDRGGAPVLSLVIGARALVGLSPDGAFEVVGDRAEGLSFLRCDVRGVRVAAGDCASSAERPGLVARALAPLLRG